ncbi:MAG: hypothetical protein J5382_11965 [Bacteroidales bacterium]|nr:hypothetical protein [Bacteroidales bacterium]
MPDYRLNQTGAEVQEAIDKIIDLGPATSRKEGTMSPTDKLKLDSLEDIEPLTNLEIENLLN